MHYFTIEQRETLERQLHARADELAGTFAGGKPETVDEIAERQREIRELAYITDALVRIHSPDFGLCADCGGEIPFSRLHANPIATRCRLCQDAHEHAAARLGA